MRKAVKNNLLEIFKTIYEAHEIVKGFIEKKEYENAQNLLADCQETAIQLGNLIEESEGEDFVTVSFLEEYCEALYEAATNLSEESNGYKVQKQLDKKIIKAENSAKIDINVKLEIVFMPYKASMWDSLESVWKAADEHPNCDVYVVPIPYYDRKPGGAFGEFHYEGNEFPEYVPIVHYDTYNLEQRRPDMIFFHYPYDANNYVTSVDPRFYSSELNKYTDKLVYIPYFVSAEPDPENVNTVEYLSRYAITPGVLNADKVIVQSEAMRLVYIKALLGRFGDTPSNRRIVEGKILGIGSPKFDKVESTTKDNIDIPESWRKLITNPDGSSKKIVLYNTGLGTLLNQNEKVINKIREIFHIFSERRGELVLLWRPHPLIQATIESMRPQLWQEYKQLLDMYISEGWGIYDDTADLDRAIALSDAYIGDKSSVVQLYKKTGKPVCKLNYGEATNSDTSSDKLNLNFTSAASINNKLYFPAYDFNGLFSYDMITEQTSYEGCFDTEKFFQIDLYKDCIEYNNKVYFTPCCANHIAEYDIETKQLYYYTINEWDKTANTGIWQSYKVDNDVYMISFFSNQPIYKFNLEDKQFVKCVDCIDNSYMHMTRATCIIDNKIYIAYTTSPTIYEFNIISNEVKSYNIKVSTGFWGIGVHDEILWLISSDKKKIIKYNLKNSEAREFTVQDETACIHICCINGAVWTCAENEPKLFKFNIDTETFETIELDENKVHFSYSKVISNVNLFFYKIYTDNDDIVLYSFRLDKIIRINTKTNEITYIPAPYVSEKWYQDMLSERLEKNNYNFDGIDIDSYVGLEQIAELLSANKISIKSIQNKSNATNGSMILKNLI